MANDAGCEICVWLIMLQYFFFKTFACEMVDSIVLSDGLEQLM